MDCKIYCYQYRDTCDLVFEIKGFGVVTIEHYDLDNEFWREHWKDLKEYESTLKRKFIKTYIGTVN